MLSKAWTVIKILLLTLLIYFGSSFIGGLPFIPFGEKFAELYSDCLTFPILLVFIYLNTKNLKETCYINKISIKLGFKSILIALGVVFASLFILEVLQGFLHIKSEGLDSNVQVYNFLSKSPMGLISLCILGPISEEILSRGFLLTKLRKVVNIKTAIIVQAMFFGFLHGNTIQFIDAFFIGIILGCVCYYTKSIFPGIIIHMTNNILSSLDMSWLNKHQFLEITLGLAFFFIGIYTLWSVINECKQKDKTFKSVA